ncbi:MAG: hypothetical protein IJV98_00485 [Clostridia bacterium]|nr:hypothetical protein [Clostridia bacterium]
MENKNNGGFHYTYSAGEQAEIRRIREKYAITQESKLDRLRRLDAGATERAQAIALIFGIVGVLILGLGMSLVMSELAEILGVYKRLAMPLGILIGIVGGILTGLAYPIYNLTLRHERKRIAPEILRLTDELMK